MNIHPYWIYLSLINLPTINILNLNHVNKSVLSSGPPSLHQDEPQSPGNPLRTTTNRCTQRKDRRPTQKTSQVRQVNRKKPQRNPFSLP